MDFLIKPQSFLGGGVFPVPLSATDNGYHVDTGGNYYLKVSINGAEYFLPLQNSVPGVTPTVTPTISPSISLTPSVTPTISETPTETPSPTKTPTETPTPTVTLTPSVTPTESAPIPFVNVDVNEETIPLTNSSTYITVTNFVNTFNFNINSHTITFTNYFDENDINNCYIEVLSSVGIECTPQVVFVTNTATLSTVDDESYTFYYYSTGSLVLGFSLSSTPLPPPTPSPTPNVFLTPTATRTLTPTPQVTKTNTPTPSITPTIGTSNTPTPTLTKTPTLTRTPNTTPTFTRTPTRTSTPTPTEGITTTPTPTPTKTPTYTPSNSPSPTFTPTKTVTQTVTKTFTPTPSKTPTKTPTPTPTTSVSPTPGVSSTGTPTPTPTTSTTPQTTPTVTRTPTPTRTPTWTSTLTPTPTLTVSPSAVPVTPTPTVTRTVSPTPTLTPSLSGVVVTATPTPTRSPTINASSTPTPTPTRTPLPTSTPATPTPSITTTPTVTPSLSGGTLPTTGILFDKSSFIGVVDEPYLSALNNAVDRWGQKVQIDPSVVTSIRTFDPSFMGIKISGYTISNLGENSYIAACGVASYVDLSPGVQTIQFNTYEFDLYVNTYFAPSAAPYNFSQQDWANVMTHELGHGLGIGIYWNVALSAGGAIPPANFFLSGANAYPNIGNAYNTIIGNSRLLVPLEDTGGSGTSSAHFEDTFRSSSYPNGRGVSYPGLTNELMVGYYSTSTNFVISNMSLSALKDFGYQIIGAAEGTPILANSLMPAKLDIDTASGDVKKYNCDCVKKPEPISIAKIDTNTGEVLISPIVI